MQSRSSEEPRFTVTLDLMDRPKFKLTLFVKTDDSRKALSMLYRALEFHDYTDYELEIVDVLKEPIKAEPYGIQQTPTLVNHTDDGNVFISKDLDDVKKIRAVFGFKSS